MDVQNQDNIVLSDFIEDFSYDRHSNELEYEENVSRHKQFLLTKQRRRGTSKITNNPVEEDENIYPPFKTFDRPTAKILQSIASFNSYYSGQFGKIIGKGTNSVVIHVWIHRKSYPPWHPCPEYRYDRLFRSWKSEDNAVKVYKLSEDVVKNEKIYERVRNEKEHLELLGKAKCNVAKVIRCCQNVLVMSMVGTGNKTAPSITTIPLERFQELYHKIVKQIVMWYKTLGVVHGQLCSQNILYWEDDIYYIGWSHSVTKDHPMALKKLMKDCIFITKFFEARFVQVKSTEKLFKEITGFSEIDNSVLDMIHITDLWKSKHMANPNRMSNTLSPNRSLRFK